MAAVHNPKFEWIHRNIEGLDKNAKMRILREELKELREEEKEIEINLEELEEE